MDDETTKKSTYLYFLLGLAVGAGAALLLGFGLGRERELKSEVSQTIRRAHNRSEVMREIDRAVSALPGEDEPDVI